MLPSIALLIAAEVAASPARVLTLEDAVRSAREHQPQLRQARANTRAAQARSDEARAPLLPQLTANASYARTTANFFARPGLIPTNLGSTRSPSFTTFNFFNDSVTVNQLIYDFGQTTGRFHANQALAQAQEDTEQATAQLIVLNVRTAFFNARANKAIVGVASDSLANTRRHLEQTMGLVETGRNPEIDLAQGRTDTANAEVALITAENNYESSKVALNQAMGIEGPIDYETADESLPELPGEAASIDVLLEEARKARPDLAALEAQARSAQLTLRSTQGAFGPALGANAGFTQGGTSLENLGWNLSAGLTLSWGIYQGGLTNALTHEAEANLAAIIAQADGLRQQIRSDVATARLAVRAAKATLNAAHQAVTNARLRLQLAESRYEAGVGNAIELGDAQLAMNQASAQAVQADYQVSTSRAALLRALGRP